MAPVPLHPPIEGQLETRNGECAKIESSRRNLRIVAKRLRGNGPKVSLWTWKVEGKNVYLSFCFELKNQKYFAAVNTETSDIQVEPLNDPMKIDDKFLFKWVYATNLNTWNSLSSVAEPSKYLSVSDSALTLSTSPETLFKFRCNTNTCRMRTRRLLSRHSPI